MTKKRRKRKLNKTQTGTMRLVARLLLSGETYEKIRDKVGISIGTISRWQRKDSAFREVMDKIEDRIYGAADNELRHCYILAVKATKEQLQSKDPYLKDRAVDRIFRAHGVFVDRKGQKPKFLEYKETKEISFDGESLDKAIELMKLTQAQTIKKPKLIDSNVIDVKSEEVKNE